MLYRALEVDLPILQVSDDFLAAAEVLQKLLSRTLFSRLIESNIESF
jgi:hypothetical protein